MDWTRSAFPGAQLAPAAREWADPSAWLYKQGLAGELPNRDTYLAESKLRTRTVVAVERTLAAARTVTASVAIVPLGDHMLGRQDSNLD